MEIIKENQPNSNTCPTQRSPHCSKTKIVKWKRIARTLGHSGNKTLDSKKRLTKALIEGSPNEPRKKNQSLIKVSAEFR